MKKFLLATNSLKLRNWHRYSPAPALLLLCVCAALAQSASWQNPLSLTWNPSLSLGWLPIASETWQDKRISDWLPREGHAVQVSWSFTVTSGTIAGYRVWRSTQSGGPYDLIRDAIPATASSWVDTTIEPGPPMIGFTYYYVVTAYDSSGVDGITTPEMQATVW